MTNEEIAATLVQANLITDNGDGTYEVGPATLTLSQLVQSREVIRYLFARLTGRQRRLILNEARLIADRFALAFPQRGSITRERALMDRLATEVQEVLAIRAQVIGRLDATVTPASVSAAALTGAIEMSIDTISNMTSVEATALVGDVEIV